MVRDLAKMEEVYNINKVQPVDMFPFTKHIETVTVLTLKNQEFARDINSYIKEYLKDLTYVK